MTKIVAIGLVENTDVDERLVKRRAHYEDVLSTLHSEAYSSNRAALNVIIDALASADVFGVNAFRSTLQAVRGDAVLIKAFGYRQFAHSDAHKHLSRPEDERSAEYEKLKAAVEVMGMNK
jgi:hypothetical protein